MHRVAAGDNADLVELGDVTAQELHEAASRIRSQPGVLACIPGHSSLYVIRGERSASAAILPREPRELRVRVAFDGPDLSELLERVSRETFLERVSGMRLTARYLGFRGGFAYLEGWPDEWSMPRRPTSRPHVARGTFAIAGNVAGFYPIDSPGGWNLLGRTDVDLENALTPGDVIVIEPWKELREDGQWGDRYWGHRYWGDGLLARPTLARNRRAESPSPQFAELIASPLTTIVTPVDWSNVERGLPPGGPFDDVAAAHAMSAVEGNVELFECAMTGPRLRFRRNAVIAWCTPDLELRVEHVREGEERAFGRITGGLRAYLAIGERERAFSTADRRLPTADSHVIRAICGPHDVGLHEIECEVTPHLNRVGIRLRPLRALQIEIPADLRSIGMQCGTVQLHPDGSLVAMGPDHPVTGGYLQPMTVITSERWKLAQLMPGDRVLLKS